MLRVLVSCIVLCAYTSAWSQVDPRLDLTTDYKVCGYTVRNADGSIKRNPAAVAAFKRMRPCPATGKAVGACPKWYVDHVVPLDNGGCDTPTNMQWLPWSIKGAAETPTLLPKDRFERKINASPPILVPGK